MPNPEPRTEALETQSAPAINCFVYDPGEAPPEIPISDGLLFLFPGDHQEENHHGQP